MTKRMTLDNAILERVAKEDIGDQSVLLQRLADEGWQVTQPTLSRHLKKLGIQKVAGLYRQTEGALPGPPAFTLSQVEPCLVVLQTQPGYAQPLAVMLDQKGIEGVAGTIAGDDTIFLAVETEYQSQLSSVAERIRTLLTRSGNSG